MVLEQESVEQNDEILCRGLPDGQCDEVEVIAII